jgi:SAM-dependent methyltransferase
MGELMMTTETREARYVFDQAWQQERERLAGLETLFDAASRRYLAGLGVGPGWRCLEAGCGAGSLAVWLADQVGPTGHVLATDRDTRFLTEHGRANLEVRRHDLVTDPLEADSFDLAHARAVIEHVPERGRALANLVAALRPGGWLVIEDVDFAGPTIAALMRYVRPRSAVDVSERVFRAVEALFRAVGGDPGYGAELPGALLDLGLEQTGCEIHTPVLNGGTGPGWVSLTAEQLGPRMVAAGLAGQDDVDEFRRLCAQPSFRYAPPLMVTAWGRRPAR